ncbi:RNA-binding S4 domain-containing protein [Sphingomonas paeninsulae]|jgi:ribosome-associated heat shock protein Hsp15|uniref:RNA-binding S4 domain-containing protein n=2 Tax=Sphingomonas paeninsulae TaxID=2319844 RepID=A0A494TME1_SPHPE|nr:S4 domain-containing protein [Sphingomonas paeninsulae]AYJ86255.1 RNA-binding S4 domain-containing protein [Sphingomonas paeninsulae]
MRLDKFLWFARLTKTRSAAQAIAASGHLRIDSRAIDRAHVSIRAGQVIAFPLGPRVRVLRIETLPVRRGPAPEARECYTDLVGYGKAATVIDGTAPES